MASYTDHYKIKFDADIVAAKQQIQELYTTLHKLASIDPVGSNLLGSITQIQQASKAAAELEFHLKKATNVNTGRINLKTFTRSLYATGQDLSYFQKSLQAIGPTGTHTFQQLAQSIMIAEKPLFNFNSTMQSLGTTLLNSAKWTLSSSVIHGIMGSAQKATGHVKALNKSLNEIRIVTSQSTDQMDKFAKKANQAAKNLSTTTTAYTDAALIFYQQGLNDNAVEERTQTVMKMSNVTGEAAEDVSSYMTAIWNNFDDGSKKLEYFGDVMTALGAATASSTAEIAAGLDKFAAIAQTVGLSYEYATAALATVVSETRQSADVVGNAFKTLFSRLESLSLGETLDDGTTLNKYSQALATVGVDIKDQAGQLKDMDLILDELGSKWRTLSKDQQVALAQTVAGTRQYTQLISLMKNYDTFKQNVSIASGSEGSLQEQMDIYAESWEAARKRVKASAEAIYESLLDDDLFININNGFASVLDSINGIVEGMGGLKGILPVLSSLMLAAFGPQISSLINNMTLGTKNLLIEFTNLFRTAENKKLNIYEQQRLDAKNRYVDSIDTSASYYVPGGSFGQQGRKVFAESLGTSMDEILTKSQRLTGLEKELYDLKVKSLQTTTDEVVAVGKKTSDLERQVVSTKNILNNQVKGLTDHRLVLSEGMEKFDVEVLERIKERANALNIKLASGAKDKQLVHYKGKNPTKATLTVNEPVEESKKIAKSFMEDYIKNTTSANITRGAFANELNLEGDLATDLAAFGKGEGKLDSLNSQDQVFKNISAGIDEASGKINNFEKLLGTYGKKFEDVFGSSAGKLLKDFQLSLKSVQDKTEALKRAEEQLNKARQKVASTTLGSTEHTAALQEETAAIQQLKTAETELREVSDKATNAQKAFSAEIDKMEREASEARAALLALGVNTEQMAQLEQYARKSGESMSQLVEKIRNGEYAIEELVGKGSRITSIGDKFTAVASTLSQLAMGINAFKSIGSIISDEDLSVSEKFLSIMMTLPMALGAVKTAMAAVNAITVASNALKKLDSSLTMKQILAQKAKIKTDKGEQVSTLALIAAKIVKNAVENMGWVGAIAGLAIAATVIASLNSETLANQQSAEALREKAAAEEEAAKKSEESANKAREAYDNLNNTFKEYLDLKDKIGEFTTGTEEWTQAIENTNEKARELLLTYSELSQYASMQNGVLTISEEGYDKHSKELEIKAAELERASKALQMSAKITSAEADEANIKETIKKNYSWDTYGSQLNEFTVEAQKKYIDTDLEGYNYLNYEKIIEDALAIFQENPAISEDELSKNMGISKELAEQLIKNSDSLLTVENTMRNLDRTANLLYTEIAKDIYKNDPIVQQSKNKEAFYRLGGEIYQSTYDDVMDTANTDYDFARDYGFNWLFGDALRNSLEDNLLEYIAAQYGVSTSEISAIDWGETEDNYQVASFKIGNQQYDDIKITSAELAGYEADKKATAEAQNAIETLNNFMNSDSGALAMKAYGEMSASGLTGQELADLAFGGDQAFQSLREAYKEAGFDDAKIAEMEAEIQGYIKASQQARQINKDNASDYIQSLFDWNVFKNVENTLSESAQKQMVSNLDAISTQFGDTAGEDYIKALKAIPNEEMRERFAQIDVTAEDSEEAIEALAKEFKLSESETENLINNFDDFQIAVTQTSEVIQKTVTSILKSIDKLKLGDTVDQTQYDDYAKIFGDNVEDYFVKMADGTYMLTVEATSFKEMAKEATKEWALGTRDRMNGVLENSTTNLLAEDYSENYLKQTGPISSRVRQEASNFLEASGLDLTKYGVTRDASDNLIIDEHFIQAFKAAQDIYNDANLALNGLYDSVLELDLALKTGEINQENYNANIRRLATLYPDARDELNDYNKAVRLYGKDSQKAAEAQIKLNKAVRQGQIDEAAAAILKASEKMKELTAGTEDYIKELNNQADAFNSAFGTGVDTTFIEANREMIETWAKGGEEAEEYGNKLYHMAMQASSGPYELLKSFGLVDADIRGIVSNWDNLTFDVEGNADLTQLMASLQKAGLSAKQVAAILASIGQTQLSIKGQVYDISTPEGLEGFGNAMKNWSASVEVTGIAPKVTPIMENVNSELDKKDSGGGGGEKKKAEDEVERYHETERQLSQLERITKRLGEAKEEAFGQSKIDLINAETDALEKELKTLEGLDDEILGHLSQDRANIAQYGATFDEFGNISNYEEMVTNMVNRQASGAISTEEYDYFKKMLEQYEETLDKWYDNQDNKRAKQREIISKEIEAIDAKVEIELHLSERELKFIEHQLERLQDESFKAAESINLISQKTDEALKNSVTYQEGIKLLEQQAAENLAKGMYTDNQGYSDEMRAQMEGYADGLLESSSTLLEARKEVEAMFGEAIDEVNEKFDEQISRFDSYGAVFDHYKNIIGLSGKSIKDSALLIELGNKSVENSINKLESTRKKQETLESALASAQAEYESALARGNEEDVEYWKQTVEDITAQVEQGKANVLAAFEETLQAAADNFAAAVEQTMAVFSANMTKFSDLDIAQDNYEKQKTLAEQYLDINTQNYELSKLMRNINAEIDKTDNLAAKIKLRDVLEEINEIQASNAELSQYDLDMLNAKYQLKLAEIALEEAQNAKSQVRLTQTAGGGWGYVYTADQSAIDSAEQNYEDKLYEIQKLSQDRMNELSDNILQNYQEYRDAVGALKAEDFENKEAYMAEIDRLTEYYTERDKYLQGEFNKAVQDSGQVYGDTLLGQTLATNSYQEAHNKFVTETNAVVDSMSTHYNTWKTSVTGAYDAAGKSQTSFKDQAVGDADTIIKKSEELKIAVDKMAKESEGYLKQVAVNVGNYQTTYSEKIGNMVTSNDNLYTKIKGLFDLLSAPPDVKITIDTDEKKIQSLQEQLALIPKNITTTHAMVYTSSGSGSSNGLLSGGENAYNGTAQLRSKTHQILMEKTASSDISQEDAIKKAKMALVNDYSAQRAFGAEHAPHYLNADPQTIIEKMLSSPFVKAFDTGGYTGAWGVEGKLAMLHEKEIVLNKSDTQNLLTSIEIVRSIAQQLDALSQYQRIFDIASMFGMSGFNKEPIEQNVHITAEFPNAVNHTEIEEAFNNLINYSSQYINRYNK